MRDLERELYAPGNDRATAVLFGSLLDQSIALLLTTAVREDLNSKDRQRIFEFDGVLGNFSARIIMAYALELLGPKTRHDLDLVRVLRNEFAHSRLPISFETPEVQDVCTQLQMCDLPESFLPPGALNSISHGELSEDTARSNPKMRVIISCHAIAYRMNLKRNGPVPGDFTIDADKLLP